LFETGKQVLEFFRRISGIGGGREQSAGDHRKTFCLGRLAAYSQSASAKLFGPTTEFFWQGCGSGGTMTPVRQDAENENSTTPFLFAAW
jgi:hypothetical protein